jgi:hypothetical protein
MRLLTCVLSCQKNKELWPEILSRLQENIIIFSGGSDISYLDPTGKLLYLNCNDFYEGLPEKIICMIEQVLKLKEFNDVTHILKIDDHDTMFTKDSIQTILKLKELNEYEYLGQNIQTVHPFIGGNRSYHFRKVTPGSYWDSRPYNGPYTDWADGGCTYILSRKALEIIHSKYNSSQLTKLRQNEIYEDLMIAKLLLPIVPKKVSYNIKGDKF